MKNLLHHLIQLVVCCTVISSFGQNLVANGGFEELYTCPETGGMEPCKGWFSLNDGSPDLFNACMAFGMYAGVPNNSFGHQYPLEGNGYAGGLYLFSQLSLGAFA